MNLEDILLRGTRAAQPVATTVAEGSLYYVTDETIIEQSRAGIWVIYSSSGTGNVVGPVSSVDDRIATFDGITGKLIQDSGSTIASILATAGDVDGPTSSIDSEIVLFDGITGKLLKRASGSGFAKITSGVLGTHNLLLNKGITIDGGGSALTTGLKGFVSIPFAGTITRVRLLADQVGSVVIDIWKDSYANFPPTIADTITAAAKPTISAANKSEDSTLTEWTTAIIAGDVLAFNVDSIATITRVTLELTIQVTP